MREAQEDVSSMKNVPAEEAEPKKVGLSARAVIISLLAITGIALLTPGALFYSKLPGFDAFVLVPNPTAFLFFS